MIQKTIIKLILFILVPSFAFASVLVDPSLNPFLRADQKQKVRVVALMAYTQAGATLPQRYNYRSVRQFLNSQAQTAWKELSAQAKAKGINLLSAQIKVTALHWINNSITAEVTPEGLKQLASLDKIQKIYNDNRMTNERPMPGPRRSDTSRYSTGLPYDLALMKMNQVYANYPQINGQGILVGHIDTGVDGSHPALAGKIHIFWNAATKKQEPPKDSDEHGTHTAGTIVGTGQNGTHMGVAPGAKLISSGALGNYEEMLRAMEFMLDPDGNPNTADFPRVVTNSWNCEGAPDLEAFYRGISAWEASGIFPVFSAGNAGPSAASITKPHEHPMTFAVAALDLNGKVASFSSRGPGKFNGQATQKPDISAPGVDILSSVPGGKFVTMSGTSMATPHIAGLVALLLQANPKLTPSQLREVMVRSTVYVDENGAPNAKQQWNANYGLGIVDAYAALNLATGRKETVTNLSRLISPMNFITEWEPELDEAIEAPVMDFTAPFVTDESRWIKID